MTYTIIYDALSSLTFCMIEQRKGIGEAPVNDERRGTKVRDVLIVFLPFVVKGAFKTQKIGTQLLRLAW